MIAADALAPKPHTPLHPLNTVTEACAGDLALVCVGAQGDIDIQWTINCHMNVVCSGEFCADVPRQRRWVTLSCAACRLAKLIITKTSN